ncbi:bifunctional ADP-dependent NAD(P)H-hydrate dehydratase/NAD(P)H-hydrate epimerase [Salinicoccus albus]|uniref:bifunctional ADP-dependent NAD(P)H-hydrate dehydratase/NAD(P)H-hydrate epimerase n=1 Tax=Salinicoccus albus TaxID=418756 RepID=UPI000360796F|nr:bifunctional ADP-dependent NAD(P)H-hydrate dehydratase/NAD(P)H-hydrate epimerase [Salinicoccus albus]
MRVVTGDEMKQIDAYTMNEIGLSGVMLMENAGQAAARRIMDHYPNETLSVLIGSGNNGGDGFVIARMLKENGFDVKVLVIPDEERISGDARYHKNVYKKCGHTYEQYDKDSDIEADVIIDTMLGTGVKGEIRAPYNEIFSTLNHTSATVVSVDLPSGVPAETGTVPKGALKADRTIIIELPKLSYYSYPAREYYGRAEVAGIGIPAQAVESAVRSDVSVWTFNDTRENWKRRAPDSHKGTHGKAGIIAGSTDMPGAAVLTSMAAVKSGAGLTAVNTPPENFPIVAGHTPEATFYKRHEDLEDFTSQKDVIAFGPGMGVHEETEKTLEYLIENFDGTLVVDADGLTGFSHLKGKVKARTSPLIITPHPGEMAKLMDDTVASVNQNRFEIAQDVAREYGIYVVLKGAFTLTAAPSGKIWINDTGNPGLAKGGSGDVLTGMITAFACRYESIGHAVSSAVFMHGFTAEYVHRQSAGIDTISASDIADHLKYTFKIVEG